MILGGCHIGRLFGINARPYHNVQISCPEYITAMNKTFPICKYTCTLCTCCASIHFYHKRQSSFYIIVYGQEAPSIASIQFAEIFMGTWSCVTFCSRITHSHPSIVGYKEDAQLLGSMNESNHQFRFSDGGSHNFILSQ